MPFGLATALIAKVSQGGHCLGQAPATGHILRPLTMQGAGGQVTHAWYSQSRSFASHPGLEHRTLPLISEARGRASHEITPTLW